MKTNPHILLIDDDPIFCMIAEEMLTNARFSVTTASNRHKGLQLLRDHPTLFDTILLDRPM
jgi:CheY-like chemotaxis protein